MPGLAPAVPRVVACDVDVAHPAAFAGDPAADEQQPVAVQRRRAEVVRRGVDRLRQILGRAERLVRVAPMGDPDVEAAVAAGTVRGHVQVSSVGRQDRAAVQRRRVQLRAVARDLVDLLGRRPVAESCRRRRRDNGQGEQRNECKACPDHDPSLSFPSASGSAFRGPAIYFSAASANVAFLSLARSPLTKPHVPSLSTNAICPIVESGRRTTQAFLFTTALRPFAVSAKPSVTDTFCSPFGHVPTRKLSPTRTSIVTTPASVACCVAFPSAFQLSVQLAAVGVSSPPHAAITSATTTSAIRVAFMAATITSCGRDPVEARHKPSL